MSIKSQLELDLSAAMRSGDNLRKRTIRMALSAINQDEIDRRVMLSDSEVQTILQKEVKTRRETIDDAKRAGRQDIIDEALDEIEILNGYLPEQLSKAEIETMARSAIAETGATTVRDMGSVMKILLPRVQGRAENSQVSQVVRQLLQ